MSPKAKVNRGWDIVAELRAEAISPHPNSYGRWRKVMRQSADHIERLNAEIERLRAEVAWFVENNAKRGEREANHLITITRFEGEITKQHGDDEFVYGPWKNHNPNGATEK